MGEPRAIVAGIQGVRDTIASRDSELLHALQHVGTTCEALAERVQLDRMERTALTDAVSRLSTAIAVASAFTLPPTSATSTGTVIGGTIEPNEPPSAPPTTPAFARADGTTAVTEIDLEAEAREPSTDPVPTTPARAAHQVPAIPAEGVEVRCRFGDRWVTGFEVCEVIRLDDSTRYRLRRRSDRSVIPTLFAEKDLRFFTTSTPDAI
jgi:hypothetical protein